MLESLAHAIDASWRHPAPLPAGPPRTTLPPPPPRSAPGSRRPCRRPAAVGRSPRRPPSRRRSATLRTLVLLVFGGFALLAVLGFVTVVGGAVVYSRGLPDPTVLEEIVFPEDSVIYARDGTTVLARISSGR